MTPVCHRPVVVSGNIRIPAGVLTGAVAHTLKSRLTFQNPLFIQALRLGRKGYGIPPKISCYDFDEWKGLIVPRGCVRVIQEIAPHVRYVDARSSCPRAFEPFEIPLRDYQKKAVDAFCAVRQGYVVIPCGGGKTRVALGAIARLGLRALVLVHTKDLKAQWESAAAALKIPLCVRLIQALSPSADLPPHDFLILDEAHHVAASTFHAVVDRSIGRYRLGLTATPEREDGLTQFLDLYFGDKVFEISQRELIDAGYLVVPEIRRVSTNFEFPYSGPSDYSKLIKALVADEERNALVIRTVVSSLSDGSVGLVLTNRIDQCQKLADEISACGVAAAALTSKQTKKERLRRLAMAEKGDIRVLCATTLADEGLDLPILSKVFLAHPSRAMARTIQRLGRIMRPCENKKQPVLYDFVDDVGVLKAQARKRLTAYRKVLGADCNISKWEACE